MSPKNAPATRTLKRARRPDFSSRLRARTASLGARLRRRETLLQAIRESSASAEPALVAGWLVRQLNNWIPAPCWAVVARDGSDRLTTMAEVGLTPGLGPSLWSAAEWVMAQGAEFCTADLSKEAPVGGRGSGSVLALPLRCRNQTVGVAVAIDPQPSARQPTLSPGLMLALRAVLEPPAIALESALALQRAEELSVTDDLTRLSNSRYLNLVLRRETKRAMRSKSPLSLLFLDLDGFKQVNDSHGHLAGSKTLVEAAAVIRGCARETDVVARFGGDEFALILPDTGPEGAMAVAARIRDRVRAATFLTTEGLAVTLTASIGVATLPGVAESAEELLRAADTAMYHVKAAGKNGIHVA
jgi:diguanylate cyclase (GGDEF)-like protein